MDGKMCKQSVRHVSNIKYRSSHCLLRTQLHGINKKQRLTFPENCPKLDAILLEEEKTQKQC